VKTLKELSKFSLYYTLMVPLRGMWGCQCNYSYQSDLPNIRKYQKMKILNSKNWSNPHMKVQKIISWRNQYGMDILTFLPNFQILFAKIK
jgi:hypothetical protein